MWCGEDITGQGDGREVHVATGHLTVLQGHSGAGGRSLMAQVEFQPHLIDLALQAARTCKVHVVATLPWVRVHVHVHGGGDPGSAIRAISTEYMYVLFLHVPYGWMQPDIATTVHVPNYVGNGADQCADEAASLPRRLSFWKGKCKKPRANHSPPHSCPRHPLESSTAQSRAVFKIVSCGVDMRRVQEYIIARSLTDSGRKVGTCTVQRSNQRSHRHQHHIPPVVCNFPLPKSSCASRGPNRTKQDGTGRDRKDRRGRPNLNHPTFCTATIPPFRTCLTSDSRPFHK